MSIRNGRVFPGMELGSCRLIRVLRRSSVGISFLAQHGHLQEQVIVEIVIAPSSLLSPSTLANLLAQFRRIASHALLLAHPHILPILEYGEQDGIAYLVMPYLQNVETLKECMMRTGPFPLYVIRNFLEQLADALTYAHARDIAHGSITSAHVLIKDGDFLLFTDFGIAQFQTHIQPDQVVSIRTKGETPQAEHSAYTAPEQLLHGKIDTCTDIYSVGVLLYQMVTGNMPFTASSATDLLIQHLQDRPPAPRVIRPDLPEECEQVILQAMAQHPEDRYRQIDDLKRAFCSAISASASALPLPNSFTTEIGKPQHLAKQQSEDQREHEVAFDDEKLSHQQEGIQKQDVFNVLFLASPPLPQPAQVEIAVPAIQEPAIIEADIPATNIAQEVQIGIREEASPAKRNAEVRKVHEVDPTWKRSVPSKPIEPSSTLKMRLKAQAGTSFSTGQRSSQVVPRIERKLFALSANETVMSFKEEQIRPSGEVEEVSGNQGAIPASAEKPANILRCFARAFSKLQFPWSCTGIQN